MEKVAIKYLAKIIQTGKTPPTKIKEYFSGEIDWYTPTDLGSGKYLYASNRKISKKAIADKKGYLLPKNCLFVSCIGIIGKVGISTTEASSNQQITAIFPNERADINYLYYWFLKNQAMLASLSNNAVVPILNNKRLGDIQIPLPPLPVQRRIAAILDAADEHRRKTQALIEKYDELAQSVFLEMFGDPVRNEKGWEVKKLRDVCNKITDGTHHSPPLQDTGYPYVTAKHVKPFHLDFDAKPTYISKTHHNEIYKRCNPEYGDVLYIKDGATTGIACINSFKEPISLLSSLALLKVDSKINNYYLCFWLNNDRVKQKLVSEFMSGAAIKRFTLRKINSFEITVPQIELQNKFAKIIQEVQDQKNLIVKNSSNSETLFQSLLQRAFKGELVTEEEEVVEVVE